MGNKSLLVKTPTKAEQIASSCEGAGLAMTKPCKEAGLAKTNAITTNNKIM